MKVSWIKITTDMFSDEKIKLIEQMPEGTTILLMWIKLLTLAGRCNACGFVYLSDNLPYTDEMLSTIWNTPLMTVRLALNTFQQFKMIEVSTDHYIKIVNWEKHQNMEGLDKIREQNRIRAARFRENQKLIESNVTVTQHNETDKNREDKKRKEKENIPYSDIIDYLNMKSNSNYKPSTAKNKDLIKARWNEGYKIDDFKIVIDKKCNEWLNTDQEKYLRPETLFGNKFEGYLNQKEGKYGRDSRDNSKDSASSRYDFSQFEN